MGNKGIVSNPTVNNFGPPPVQFYWATESIYSTSLSFKYETKATVSVSEAYMPVSLGFLCDAEIKDTSFEGMSVNPDRPLYIHLWSKGPLVLLKVVPIKLKPPS